MRRTISPGVIHAASEGEKFNTDTSLHVEKCPTCHILFAIPQSLYKSAQRYPGTSSNGWELCCPLGHKWWYTGKSVEEKLEEERRRVQATRDLLEHEERSHNATKGHLTRQKKRVAAGVCPCCNRTFQQLARHMAAKHPDFANGEAKTRKLPTGSSRTRLYIVGATRVHRAYSTSAVGELSRSICGLADGAVLDAIPDSVAQLSLCRKCEP